MAGPSRVPRGQMPYELQGRDVEELRDVRTPLVPSEAHLLLRRLCSRGSYGDYLNNTGIRLAKNPIDAPAARVFSLPSQGGSAYVWSDSLKAQFAEKAEKRATYGPAGPQSALARLYFVTVLAKEGVPKVVPFEVRLPTTYLDPRGGRRELMGRSELLGTICLLFDLSMRSDREEAEKILRERTSILSQPMPGGAARYGTLEYTVLRCDLPLDAMLRPPYREPPLEEREYFALALEYRLSKRHFSAESVAAAARELDISDLAAAVGMERARVLAQSPPLLRDYWGMAELHLFFDVNIAQVLEYVAGYQSTLQLGGGKQERTPEQENAPLISQGPVPVALLRRVDRLVSAVRVTAERAEDAEFRSSAGKCGTRVTKTYVADNVHIFPAEEGGARYTAEPATAYRETVVRSVYLSHLPHDLAPDVVSQDNRGYPLAVWHLAPLTIAAMSVRIGGMKGLKKQPAHVGPLCRRLSGPGDTTPLDDLGGGTGIAVQALPPLASTRTSTPAKPKTRPTMRQETPEEEETRLLAETAGSRIEQTMDDLSAIFEDEDED
jgi:hypothetical protein